MMFTVFMQRQQVNKVKITRKQLSRLIREEITLYEAGANAISALSVVDSIDKDSGRQASIENGSIHDGVTQRQWLDFMNILYRGRINSSNHDWYYYLRPFFKASTVSNPITGDHIEMMMSKPPQSGFQPMTEDDWRRFREAQAEDARRKPGDVMDHKGNIINLGS